MSDRDDNKLPTISTDKSSKVWRWLFMGSFAEPSFVAGFLIIAIPMLAYFIFTTRSKVWQVSGLFLLILAIFELMTIALTLLLIIKDRKKNSYGLVMVVLFLPLLSTRFSITSLLDGTARRFSTWEPALETGHNESPQPGDAGKTCVGILGGHCLRHHSRLHRPLWSRQLLLLVFY